MNARCCLTSALLLLAPPVLAASVVKIERISPPPLDGQPVTGSPLQGDSGSPVISADGRCVAFLYDNPGRARIPGLPGVIFSGDVLVRDRQTGVTEPVSVSITGQLPDGFSDTPTISADGRFIAFVSNASNLVSVDTNGRWDVFLRDRQSGRTEIVSVAATGEPANGHSSSPVINADGRFVAFVSSADNLVSGETSPLGRIYVRDRQSGTIERVDVSSDGPIAISADGRLLAFSSSASQLVPEDTNGTRDVFVRDRQTGKTELVSVDNGGVPLGGCLGAPSISADGRFVAFWSEIALQGPRIATSAPPPNPKSGYVYVRDRQSGTTDRGSRTLNSWSADPFSPSISADGRLVTFRTEADDLVPGDTNGRPDVFVWDRQLRAIERVSVSAGGVQANGANHAPRISADGRFIAFWSDADNLVPGDTNGHTDVFVVERE